MDEESLLKVIAKYDVARHLPGLRKLASQKFPHSSTEQLCFSANYDVHPPKFGIRSAADALSIQCDGDAPVIVSFLKGGSLVTGHMSVPVPGWTSARSDSADSSAAMPNENRHVGVDDRGNTLEVTRDGVDDIIVQLQSIAPDHWFSRCRGRLDEIVEAMLPKWTIEDN